MPKVKVGDELHEVSIDDIQLEDGKQIIDPSNPPSGLYTEDAVNSMVKDNVNKTKSRLLEDDSFKNKVLQSAGIVLGEDGKPKGLKPEVDIDEVKTSVAKQVSADYEEKLEKLNKELQLRNEAVIESSIMEAVSGHYKDDWVKSFDGSKPLAVKQFRERIGVDEDGQPYVKDEKGEKMFKGNGLMRPKEYLLDEKKFGDLLKDNRQKGSGFQGGSSGTNGSFTRDQIKNMSEAEYESNREAIQKAQSEGRVK